MSRRYVTLTIQPDVARFTAAMASVQKAIIEAGRKVAAFIDSVARALWPVAEKDAHIRRYGPRNVTGDGLWQSDLCAGWLHDSCPSSHCDCNCHGGNG